MTTRREFLFRSALFATGCAAAALPLEANPLGLPIGCQTWPVRRRIAADFPGTLRLLAQAGFQDIELCSPVGYADNGFGGLARYKPAQLRRIIAEAGLRCFSSHFTIQELRAQQPARLDWARELGLTQMLVPSLDGPRHPTLEDVKRAAGEYNQIAERAARAGIQQGLHNENFEDAFVGQRRVYDLLFQYLDPKLVKFQYQISALQFGMRPLTYLTRYPGRFISLHLQGWSAKTRRIVPLGQSHPPKDSLDWPRIFHAARRAGVRNYFLEMSLPMMEASLPYLRRLT